MIFNVWVSSVIYVIPFFTLALILFFYFIDYTKNREKGQQEFISFIISCYNDQGNVADSIKSIYKSYNNFELFVIDDKSKDGSLEILKELRKKYRFNLIKNPKNLGKSRSINRAISRTSGKIIFVVDADVSLTKKAVDDVLARFNNDPNIAAISCAYRVRNKGFLARLQDVEYSGLRIVKSSQNITSVLSLWGGCLAVKRKPFLEVGKFSENMLVEDIDLALKLNERGYRVEQSSVYVMADAPTTIRSWVRQKIRWSSGGVQCLLTHPFAYVKNPIQAMFTISNLALTIVLVFYLIAFIKIIFLDAGQIFLGKGIGSNIVNFIGGFDYRIIMHSIFVKFGFMVLSLPSVIFLIKSFRDVYKIVYVIPFSFFYSPMYTALYFFAAWPIGVKKYFKLKEGGRAW